MPQQHWSSSDDLWSKMGGRSGWQTGPGHEDNGSICPQHWLRGVDAVVYDSLVMLTQNSMKATGKHEDWPRRPQSWS